LLLNNKRLLETNYFFTFLLSTIFDSVPRLLHLDLQVQHL
jgi:hypothetical protein